MHRGICVNGLTPAELIYAPFISELEGRAELIPKDLEGYAAQLADDYGPATEIAAINRVADIARWDTFHLIGHSFGASVALAFADQHAERVLSLVLIEPPQPADLRERPSTFMDAR
jgi:pimeloyl-ACP methyl ester carboxylesterase